MNRLGTWVVAVVGALLLAGAPARAASTCARACEKDGEQCTAICKQHAGKKTAECSQACVKEKEACVEDCKTGGYTPRKGPADGQDEGHEAKR